MANQVVEELTITINVDDKGATRKLDAIESRIRRIDSISRSGGFQHLSELAKSLSAIGRTGDKLEKVATGLEKVAQSASNTVKNFGNFNTNGITNATNSIRSMTRAMSEMNSQSGREVGGGSLVSGISGVEFLGKQLSAAYSAGKRLASIPFKMMFTPLKGVAKTVNGITSSFGRLGHAIGRVALMRGIRAAIKMITAGIKEGVDHLYLWASAVGNSFKPTIDSLASSFLYLKNSIGAAVSPLLDALAPALETVINKIVDVINIFNQAIATLTGASTWRKAIRSAADYSNNISGLGHEAEGANDSVKELKRTLLGFDEINRLDDKEKTISKGNKGKDATGMYAQEGALSFEEVPISNAIKDFIDKLKKAWENADFTEIGSTIGSKIGNALLNVKWDKIQSGVTTLAKSVGTLINGALSYNSEGGKKMWDGIAYTIYNAINTAVLGYVTFFKTVEWGGIGEGIGAALKKVVKNIQWGWISDALASFPNAVIDAINGFNKQFTVEDFKHLGEKIGECVADAIIKIKWADAFSGGLDLVTGIVQAINGCLIKFNDKWATIKDAIVLGIAGVDPQKWSDLGTALGNLVFNAANFIVNVVECLVLALEAADWNKIWEGFKKGLDKCDWTGLVDKITTLITGHIGTISFVLALMFSAFKIMQSAKTLTALIRGGSVSGAATASTFGSFLSNISMAAGVLLLIEGFNSIMTAPIGTLKENLISALKGGLKTALGGAMVGLALGGVAGAFAGGLIGLTLGVALRLWISEVMPKIDQKALGAGFRKQVKEELANAGLNADALDLNTSDADDAYKSIINYENSTAQSKNNRGFQTNDKLQIPVQIKPTAPTQEDFETVYKTMDQTMQLITVQDPLSPVKIEGIKDEHIVWNGQLDVDWKKVVDKKRFAPFKTQGLVNENKTWWSNLAVWWALMTAKYTASKFFIGGVNNESETWWSQVFTAWNQYIKNNDAELYADVTLDDGSYGLWNAFVGAFNKLQKYFNENPLTASVKTSTSSHVGGHASEKANGGVYKNGRWYPVTNFAGGGNPSSGQMFIAREAGPELVGTIGGNTAVLNNDQIVNSVASGVAQAVSSVLGAGSGAPIDITIKVDSETLYRSVKKGERKANGRYGTIVAVG